MLDALTEGLALRGAVRRLKHLLTAHREVLVEVKSRHGHSVHIAHRDEFKDGIFKMLAVGIASRSLNGVRSVGRKHLG